MSYLIKGVQVWKEHDFLFRTKVVEKKKINWVEKIIWVSSQTKSTCFFSFTLCLSFGTSSKLDYVFNSFVPVKVGIISCHHVPKTFPGWYGTKIVSEYRNKRWSPKEINSYEKQWEQTSQVVVPIGECQKTIIKYKGNWQQTFLPQNILLPCTIKQNFMFGTITLNPCFFKYSYYLRSLVPTLVMSLILVFILGLCLRTRRTQDKT